MRKKSVNGTSEQQRNNRQMVYQRGIQKDASPNYVFLYSDDEDSSNEENIPLGSRIKPSSLPRKIEVIEIQVKSDDTLQALALRYRCTISELKRINKIHKENEIFAHRVIRVPVQPYSLLTENLSEVQLSDKDVQSTTVALPTEPSTSSAELIANSLVSSIATESSKPEINTIILNSLCEPLSTYNFTENSEVQYSESDQLISLEENKKQSPSRLVDTFKCSGDDCGLSWTQLVGFSLLLGFAGPIIYILYITEFSSKESSSTNH